MPLAALCRQRGGFRRDGLQLLRPVEHAELRTDITTDGFSTASALIRIESLVEQEFERDRRTRDPAGSGEPRLNVQTAVARRSVTGTDCVVITGSWLCVAARHASAFLRTREAWGTSGGGALERCGAVSLTGLALKH
jgi:hypothetical protein